MESLCGSEGGSIDIIARTLPPLAEEKISNSIFIQNKVGASRTLHCNPMCVYLHTNVYTLLFGAKTPDLYISIISLKELLNRFRSNFNYPKLVTRELLK